MTAAEAIQLLTALASAYQVGSKLVADARAAMSETDKAALDQALAKLAAENDAAFSRVSAKLDAAANT